MEDQSRSFAIKEATHVIDLVDKLVKAKESGNLPEYFSLDSELYSHFTNISGLLSALKSCNDEESNKIVQELEKSKEIFLNFRKSEGLPGIADKKEKQEYVLKDDISKLPGIGDGLNELDGESNNSSISKPKIIVIAAGISIVVIAAIFFVWYFLFMS